MLKIQGLESKHLELFAAHTMAKKLLIIRRFLKNHFTLKKAQELVIRKEKLFIHVWQFTL